MLKTMRNSFHHLKWTLFAVIVVFILGFVFLSGSGRRGIPPARSSRASATRGSRPSSSTASTGRQVERYRQMYQGNFSPELERALDLPRNVLDAMIERKLRLEAARRLDLRVSDEELARKIVALPVFQENGQFIGREKYDRPLALARHPSGDLRGGDAGGHAPAEVLRAREGWRRRSRSGGPARSTPAQNDKATIEYILVPAEPPGEHGRADRRGPEGVLREEQGALPGAGAAPREVPAGRQGARSARRSPITDAEIRAEYEKRRRTTFAVPEQVNVCAHPRRGRRRRRSGRGRASEGQGRESLAARAKAGDGLREARQREHGRPERQGRTAVSFPRSREGRWFRSSTGRPSTWNRARSEARSRRASGTTSSSWRRRPRPAPARSRRRARAFPEISPRGRRGPRPSGSRRSSPERSRRMTTKSDEELRKLQSDVVTYNSTEWFSRKGDRSPESARIPTFRRRRGSSRSARFRPRRSRLPGGRHS